MIYHSVMNVALNASLFRDKWSNYSVTKFMAWLLSSKQNNGEDIYHNKDIQPHYF